MEIILLILLTISFLFNLCFVYKIAKQPNFITEYDDKETIEEVDEDEIAEAERKIKEAKEALASLMGYSVEDAMKKEV